VGSCSRHSRPRRKMTWHVSMRCKCAAATARRAGAAATGPRSLGTWWWMLPLGSVAVFSAKLLWEGVHNTAGNCLTQAELFHGHQL
jgi:hypothetical protein